MFLKALKQHDHDGKAYKVGDTYHLNDYYAKQFIYLGFCIEVELGRSCPEAKGEPGESGPAGIKEPVNVETPKRRYQHRDMTPVK